MRNLPRARVHIRDFHDVTPIPISEKGFQVLGFVSSGIGGSSGSFVLSPGFQAIEGGQVPQALPGQQAAPSNPQTTAALPLPVSATPQNAAAASSPLPPAAPFGSQLVDPSISPVSALPSRSSSAQISAATSVASPSFAGTFSPSPLSSISQISSGIVATATVPASSSPSLAAISATSSSTIAPAAAITSSSNTHGASFWAGVALLTISGVATLMTLFAWWLHVRKRTYRRPWDAPRFWRWRRAESYEFPEGPISSSGTSGSWWQPTRGDRDTVESRRSTSNLPSPSLLSGGTSGPHFPTFTAPSPFTHGPYTTVRPLPLGLRHSDTSVPSLMQDVGSLHVANLVAGDILTSGDESSRPSTVLDDVGTPREPDVMLKPRYLSLNGSGLDVPWIQTSFTEPAPEPKPKPETQPEPETRHDTTAPLNYGRWKERLERSSVQLDESHIDPQPGTIEAWRDSLRNNIASVLGAFTSATSASTHAPPRQSVTAYDWQQAASAVSRAPSTASTWTLEETRDGVGIVHIRGVSNPFVSAASSSLSLGSGRSCGSRALPPTPSPLPRASLIPPRLPHLPPMPHVPRTSTARSTSTRRQHGSRRRHALMRRASSSLSFASSAAVASEVGSEATSVGSDMSRASGTTAAVRWARLSEKEEDARRALRQRRLRSVGGSSVRKRTRGRGGGG